MRQNVTPSGADRKCYCEALSSYETHRHHLSLTGKNVMRLAGLLVASLTLFSGCMREGEGIGFAESPAWHATSSDKAKVAFFEERCSKWFNPGTVEMAQCIRVEMTESQKRASKKMAGAFSSYGSSDYDPDTSEFAPVTIKRPTVYRSVGNTVRGSDGTSCRQVGSTTRCSDGTSYRRVGNTVRSSDGTSYRRVGNTVRSSDGTSWRRVGNTIRSSDGTSCRYVGRTLRCY